MSGKKYQPQTSFDFGVPGFAAMSALEKTQWMNFVLPIFIHLFLELQIMRQDYGHSSGIAFLPVDISLWAIHFAAFCGYAVSVVSVLLITPTASVHQVPLGLAVQTFAIKVAKVSLAPIIAMVFKIPNFALFLNDILSFFANPPSYQYEVISSGQDGAFRLLRLEGCLLWRRFKILPSSLDEYPPFDAISYTWDGQSRTSRAVIDGCCLPVTKNALQVLDDLTPVFGRRMIWIDSICINQEDMQEKRAQVRRMCDIYRRATRVIVWLSADVDVGPTLPEFVTREADKISDLIQTLERFTLRLLSPPTLPSRALERLLAHHYWSRAWVIQELTVARQVLIRTNYGWIRWGALSDFAAWFFPKDLAIRNRGLLNLLTKDMMFYKIRLSRAVHRGLEQVTVIESLRQQILNRDDAPSLLSLLVRFAKTRALDPRDKVFSLLGLAMETNEVSESPSNILVDYTTSPQELYLKIALCNLGPTNNGFEKSILLHAGIGWPRALSNLPSWVPDWTSLPETRVDAHTTSYITILLRSEALSVPGRFLKISGGRIVDKISAQTQPIDHDDLSRSWFHEICDIVGKQLEQVQRTEFDLKGDWSRCYRRCPGRWRGAIYRVLVGDIESYWGEVPECTGVTGFVRPDYFSLLDIGLEGFRRWNNNRRGSRKERDLQHSYNVWRLLPYVPEEMRENWVSIASEFVAVCRAHTHGSRFAITQTGRMCLVPPGTEAGDELLVIESSGVPFLIRPGRPIRLRTQSGDSEILTRHTLVGHCFALGMMEDQIFAGLYIHRKVNPEGFDPEVCVKTDILIQ